MRCYKKAMFRTAIIGTLAMGSLAMGPATAASAGYVNPPGFKAGVFHPISWQGTGEFGPGSPCCWSRIATKTRGSDRGVLGSVKYLSKGTPGLPDGTVLDNAFQQWHFRQQRSITPKPRRRLAIFVSRGFRKEPESPIIH